MRRIAEHGPRVHYSEIQTTRQYFSRISERRDSTDMLAAQWHQWLRHTRNEPPSIQELRQDMERKSQLKILAKQADERWAAKPSVLDSPTATSQARSATLPLNRESAEEPPKSDDQRSEEDATSEVVADPRALPKRKENPWATDRGGAGENWQPKAWSPETLKK